MKQQEVVGGYNPDDYVTERLYATATDGTKFLFRWFTKKDLIKDGKTATFALCLWLLWNQYGCVF